MPFLPLHLRPHPRLPVLQALLLCLLFAWATRPASAARSLHFVDVSRRMGLPLASWSRLKYGGAFVGDLDGDGLPDVVLFHHNQCCLTIHYNNGLKRAFTRSAHREWRDTHSVAMVRTSPLSAKVLLAISVGGGNGSKRNAAVILQASGRDIISGQTLPKTSGGRGRTVLFIRLRPHMPYYTDAIVFNTPFDLKKRPNEHHVLLGRSHGRFTRHRALPAGFRNDPNAFATVTDLAGNGVADVVTFHQFRLYTVHARLQMRDATAAATGRLVAEFAARGQDLDGLVGVMSVAELDVDNDGRWDLYLARGVRGDLTWLGKVLRRSALRDVLLVNDGGVRYRGVILHKILRNSRGVTAGDFDNDGFTDVFVSVLDGTHDYFLFNNRRGGFHRPMPFDRACAPGVPGDLAVAADFDADGHVDLLTACGDWHHTDKGGAFRLLRNTAGRRAGNGLNVLVGDSPRRRCTALHATVHVAAPGIAGTMSRRVGSPGTATSHSLVDHLHFGIGSATKASWLQVRWACGERAWRTNVRAGTSLFVGSRRRKA